MKFTRNIVKYSYALVLNLLKDFFERSKISFDRLRTSAVRPQKAQPAPSTKLRINSASAKTGYIMIFTLLIVGAAMMIVTYVGHRGSFYLPFSYMITAREKAKMLALGGVQVAIAQLALVDKSKEKKEDEGKQSAPESDFLLRILPILNRWQDFDLKENVDGIDGQIKVCLMCEEGKINLNDIIDFNKGVFKSDEGPARRSLGEGGWKAIMQEVCKTIEKMTKASDLFPAFEKIIKDLKFPFNDATELIAHKEF